MKDRAQRRRRARADEAAIRNGIDARRRSREEVISLMRVLRDRVVRAREMHDVAIVMRYLHETIGRTTERLRGVVVDCDVGCWFCCTRWVDAKVPEILYLARDVGRRRDLKAATEAGFATFGQLDYAARKTEVTPCPMLVDQRCSVYEKRPIPCRAAVSRDAGVCQQSFLHTNGPIPRPQVFTVVGAAYSLALTGALWSAGLDHRAYELTGAIHRAMTTDDVERRWLAGEDVFAGVRRRDGDLLDDPNYKSIVEEAFS